MRFHTKIKRKETLRGLLELSKGRCRSLYARRLAPVVEGYAYGHYDEEGAADAFEPEVDPVILEDEEVPF